MTMTATPLTESVLLDALRQVIDPEIGMNIVDLGLIYNLDIAGGTVRVAMTATTPGCPLQDTLTGGVQMALLNLAGVNDVHVQMVWDPPWTPAMINPAAL